MLTGHRYTFISAILHANGDPVHFTRTCAEWVTEFTNTRFLELYGASQPSMDAAEQVVTNLVRNGVTVTQGAMEAARRHLPWVDAVQVCCTDANRKTRKRALPSHNWNAIISSTPNDLSLQKCYYFLQEFEIAEDHANNVKRSYARNINTLSEVWKVSRCKLQDYHLCLYHIVIISYRMPSPLQCAPPSLI